MGRTTIEWTRNEDGTPGRNWNVTRGCSRISPGCQNCYAERIAERFCDDDGGPADGAGPEYRERKPGPFHTFAERGKGWTRKVALLPEMLAEPLRWRKPSRVFVCSTSDLFHEALSDENIDAVLAVMLVAPKHTFQVLTKRAARMRAYFAAPGLYERVLRAAGPLRVTFPETTGVCISNPRDRLPPWIWLGVSVEDQKHADARIPKLLGTPAAVRWVSYEPALGPVDFRPWLRLNTCGWCAGSHGELPCAICDGRERARIGWLVVGGESGPGARPFDLAWARSTIRQCREAGVACFFKQAGAHVVDSARGLPGYPMTQSYRDRKGADPNEWPEAMMVRQWPEVPRAR